MAAVSKVKVSKNLRFTINLPTKKRENTSPGFVCEPSIILEDIHGNHYLINAVVFIYSRMRKLLIPLLIIPLLGAGAATLWLRHFSPQLRH